MQSAVREPVTAWVALGANLGDARQAVWQAFEALGRLPGTQLMARSRLYRSAPHLAQGPDFVNAVARLETRLSAPDLLDALQALETRAGRERPYVNAPRTLDLDLILFGQSRIDSPRLQVPHPRWRERAFVLLPLADLWPDCVSADDWAGVANQQIEVWPEDGP
ncbi:MAG: 2-amino-4-hydroxy-6-hydroxymethyldihydropteridine diphosphokinase [Limnohabitans sp.]|jgi:2-amino-4-hydroxy-6-hydroxymethyldihydropteridine diphosphokinase|uniref:2-amino-4-hydroxy-6- hydroxymethyldihydropteridine diphosphokinase n=1 Tax=Limnohabitans sp. TaxID=1907725 RepID=UPI0025D2EE37|nr:2-amino-4-hydroxy-6-hydroxymethyldihydropteridine diphosphokinase [Limnohabitans sp.]MCO4088936.1 2-amino-4-hydroxy-6-hydroxymethyldihydropteridine diphosphokinase [Limnohabitans sp.]